MQFAVVLYKKGQFGNQPVNWINASIWVSRHDILVQAIHLFLQLGGIIYDYLFVCVHLIACKCVCVPACVCVLAWVLVWRVCLSIGSLWLKPCLSVSLYCNVFQPQASFTGAMLLSRFNGQRVAVPERTGVHSAVSPCPQLTVTMSTTWGLILEKTRLRDRGLLFVSALLFLCVSLCVTVLLFMSVGRSEGGGGGGGGGGRGRGLGSALYWGGGG